MHRSKRNCRRWAVRTSRLATRRVQTAQWRCCPRPALVETHQTTRWHSREATPSCRCQRPSAPRPMYTGPCHRRTLGTAPRSARWTAAQQTARASRSRGRASRAREDGAALGPTGAASLRTHAVSRLCTRAVGDATTQERPAHQAAAPMQRATGWVGQRVRSP